MTAPLAALYGLPGSRTPLDIALELQGLGVRLDLERALRAKRIRALERCTRLDGVTLCPARSAEHPLVWPVAVRDSDASTLYTTADDLDLYRYQARRYRTPAPHAPCARCAAPMLTDALDLTLLVCTGPMRCTVRSAPSSWDGQL